MGQVNWLAPTGVTGLHPVASLGPVSIGPGAAEGSWAHLPEIRISIDAVKSLAQRKMVLKLHSPGAEVRTVSSSFEATAISAYDCSYLVTELASCTLECIAASKEQQ